MAIITKLRRRHWSGIFEHTGYESRQTLMNLTTLSDLWLTRVVELESNCPNEGGLLSHFALYSLTHFTKKRSMIAKLRLRVLCGNFKNVCGDTSANK